MADENKNGRLDSEEIATLVASQ
eukprot:SAG31_NODE_37422_length_304_cov_0.995122_2_plen_22_part_01